MVADASLSQIFIVVRSPGPKEEMCILEHFVEASDDKRAPHEMISMLSFDKFLAYFNLTPPVHYEIPHTKGVGHMYPVASETDWHNILAMAKWRGIPRKAQAIVPPALVFRVDISYRQNTPAPTPAPADPPPSLPRQPEESSPPLQYRPDHHIRKLGSAPPLGTLDDPIAVCDSDHESDLGGIRDAVPEDDARRLLDDSGERRATSFTMT